MHRHESGPSDSSSANWSSGRLLFGGLPEPQASRSSSASLWRLSREWNLTFDGLRARRRRSGPSFGISRFGPQGFLDLFFSGMSRLNYHENNLHSLCFEVLDFRFRWNPHSLVTDCLFKQLSLRISVFLPRSSSSSSSSNSLLSLFGWFSSTWVPPSNRSSISTHGQNRSQRLFDSIPFHSTRFGFELTRVRLKVVLYLDDVICASNSQFLATMSMIFGLKTRQYVQTSS